MNDFLKYSGGEPNVPRLNLNGITSNQNMQEYLAKYLIKVDVPVSLSSELDVKTVLKNYDELIQDFKNVHSQTRKYYKIANSTLEIRKNLEKQMKKLSNVTDLIEKQKSKLENTSNKQTLCISAKAFQNEKSAERNLDKQIEEETNKITRFEDEIKKLQEVVKEQRVFLESPLNVLQQKVQTNRTVVQKHLQQELKSIQSQLQLAEKIVVNPAPTDSEITKLQNQTDSISSEIQSLLEKNLVSNYSQDDKLNQFRQHAKITANSKQTAKDSFNELSEELESIRNQMLEKENILVNMIGGVMPQSSDLKQFVNKLRAQNEIYKAKRAQLLELQKEIGILARTKDLLQQDDPTLTEILNNQNCNTEEAIPSETSDLQNECKELVSKVNKLEKENVDNKREVQELRLKHEEVMKEHYHYKQIYDMEVESYEKSISKLEREINKTEDIIKEQEEKWKNLRKTMDVNEETLQIINEEFSEPGSTKKQSHREKLIELLEQLKERKLELDEKIRSSEKSKEETEEQIILWNNTRNLLQCKIDFM